MDLKFSNLCEMRNLGKWNWQSTASISSVVESHALVFSVSILGFIAGGCGALNVFCSLEMKAIYFRWIEEVETVAVMSLNILSHIVQYRIYGVIPV